MHAALAYYHAKQEELEAGIAREDGASGRVLHTLNVADYCIVFSITLGFPKDGFTPGLSSRHTSAAASGKKCGTASSSYPRSSERVPKRPWSLNVGRHKDVLSVPRPYGLGRPAARALTVG